MLHKLDSLETVSQGTKAKTAAHVPFAEVDEVQKSGS